jgi:ankyrin repeat protein
MIERLAHFLKDFPASYPHRLEATFPRILDRVVETWDSPRVRDYLADLLMPARTDRQGFPPDIVKEISNLLDTWNAIRERKQTEGDVWAMEPEVAANELENRGLRVSSENFHQCVRAGDLLACQLFILAELPVDVRDGRYWTPLMISAFDGHQHVAKLLLDHGAHINAKDMAGYTPLHWAAFNGFRDVVDLLIKRGAIIGAQSKFGITPLLQAAAQGHPRVVERLLAARADPNAASSDGSTPLHKAVVNGHQEVVLHLLRARASVHAVHDDGATPLSLAEKGKHPGIRRLVRAAALAGAE